MSPCPFSSRNQQSWLVEWLRRSLRVLVNFWRNPQILRIIPLHQQPEVNYLTRFSPQVICLERCPLQGAPCRGKRPFREPGNSSHQVAGGSKVVTVASLSKLVRVSRAQRCRVSADQCHSSAGPAPLFPPNPPASKRALRETPKYPLHTARSTLLPPLPSS